MRQVERDAGQRVGLTTDERAEPKWPQREVVELKRANGILKKASAYVAQAEWTASGSRGGVHHDHRRTWLERPAPKDLEAHERTHWRLTQAAMKLRLVTAQRGGEVVSMRWADVDVAGGWWTIPEAASKNKLPHRVPLTQAAVEILTTLRAVAAADAINVFSGIRGPRHRRKVLAGLSLSDVRPHDFRRTAATRMTGAGISRLVVAKVLNHAEKGVTAVYDRASYDAEKRVALETRERALLAVLKPKKSASKVRPFARGLDDYTVSM